MSQHIGAIDPGWYPDPQGIPQERFWDGHGWTDRTRPMTIVIPAKPAAASQASPATESDAPDDRVDPEPAD